MQGNWTVCVPLNYLILIHDIQEAKCFEFTVQILPLHRSSGGGGEKNCALCTYCPPRFISVNTLYTGLPSMDEALMTT